MPDNKDTEKNIPAGFPTAQKQRKTRWRDPRQHENKEKHVDGAPDSMKTKKNTLTGLPTA
jgi:hypothetical protein